jgi:DNA topoisomerase II
MGSIDKKYQKLTDVEHVLRRPGMYVGSVKNHTEECWILEKDKFVLKEVSYNPGFLKLFDEIISNSVDEHIRDPKLNKIKVTIDSNANRITVHDNGGIPVKIHSEYNEWIPEMIFSNLKAGSNFDDTEQRTVVGTNGVGSTLTNIFSHEFIISTCDSKKKFVQKFTKNMSVRTAPKITSGKVGYTEISYVPDLKRFGLKSIDRGSITMIKKRMLDIAACNPALSLELNGEKLKYASFRKYAECYTSPVLYESSKNWKIGIGHSPNGFRAVSFVNSVETKDGGTHVNAILSQVIKAMRDLIIKKYKYDVKPSDIKQHIFLFIDSTIINPAFSSQTKEKLITEPREFGSEHKISDKMIKDIYKSEILQSVLDWMEQKQDAEAKRELRKANNSLDRSKVTKLVDAKARGDRSKCTLAIFEGDSAKTAFKTHRNPKTQGAFPLRGKFTNVTGAKITKVIQNKEVISLMASLGLQIGKPAKKLRYGKVLFYTDADVDGNSISGLLINFFATYWPEMLELGMICKVDTPLLVARKGKQILSFYTDEEYNTWKDKTRDLKSWDIEYKKGLAALENDEYKEIIKNPNVYVFTPDDLYENTLSAWFGDESAPRKDKIMGVESKKVIPPKKKIAARKTKSKLF